jgi:hypothetical protein
VAQKRPELELEDVWLRYRPRRLRVILPRSRGLGFLFVRTWPELRADCSSPKTLPDGHAFDGRNNAMRHPKEYRRPTKLEAKIHPGDGKAPVECTVVEIAERTALLSVSDVDAVPISFTLTFAGGTQVQRQCTVLSREPGQIVVLMLKSER